MQPGDLLTVPETRAILRMSRSAIYQMIHDEIIDAVRIPTKRGALGPYRVKRDSLERLIDGSGPETAPTEDAKSILENIRRESARKETR